MTTALSYLKYFYKMVFEMLFTDMYFSGPTGPVYVGWVIFACIVFGMLIKSVFVLPKALHSSGGSSNGHDRNSD